MRVSRIVAVCVVALVSSCTAKVAPPQPDHTVALPRPDHVVIVMDENKAYSQVIGSAEAPYINTLAANGANMTASYAEAHPSQPNYLAFFSGSLQGVTHNQHPEGSPFSTPNLFAGLRTAGLSFTSYSETMPEAGYDGDTFGDYVRKHNPVANWQSATPGVNQVPLSCNQPFTYFPTNYADLPIVSFVVPNLQNDMHDGTITMGDTWLRTNLDGYRRWAKTHNSLLILTFDEDDGTPTNLIPTIFVGPMVKPGKYSTTINHYNVLRTIEDMYGLPHDGAAATAAPITNIWGIH